MENIIFIGDARDFHAMDWYHSAKDVCYPRKVYFATDLINSEGQEVLIREGDNIINLYNIDWLLFPNQSRFGHIWRNFIKLLFSPFQAIRLKLISKKTPNSIFHAHTMYYMFLCWMARISYFGTPQGSEILVRPNRSKLYRYFAIKALLAARHVTVDSINMQNNIYKLCGKTSSIVQNGIDIIAILHSVNNSEKRINIVSLRGLRPPYQIDEIFKARNHCRQKPPLILIYPFSEEGYKTEILQKCEHNDLDLGRLSRIEMYKLLASTLLAISIPKSDSSPRSVYEAIFCGCCVAVTDNPWINILPDCMKSRLFMVNLDDELWLEKAMLHANLITKEPYRPSELALNLFDQKRSMKIVADLY